MSVVPRLATCTDPGICSSVPPSLTSTIDRKMQLLGSHSLSYAHRQTRHPERALVQVLLTALVSGSVAHATPRLLDSAAQIRGLPAKEAGEAFLCACAAL